MRVYLDNGATTPVEPRVLAAMERIGKEVFGNPSSLHREGVKAGVAVEGARQTLAGAIGARPEEIYFTAGGTEANNLALKGIFLRDPILRGHLIISAVEHASVRETALWLQSRGVALSVVPVDRQGRVDPLDVRSSFRADTRLVSILYGQNEVGTVQDISTIGALCRQAAVPLHTDACQGFTTLPLDVRSISVDAVTLNAHKIRGPKGVGALWVRSGVELAPLHHGGGQEGHLRGGTHNTPGIVGFGAAVSIALSEGVGPMTRLQARLFEGLITSGAIVLGCRSSRLPNNVSVRFPGTKGKHLFNELSRRGICVSLGSACRSGDLAPNPTLVAMGLSASEASEVVRLTLGRQNTEEEVDHVIREIHRIREDSTGHDHAEGRDTPEEVGHEG